MQDSVYHHLRSPVVATFWVALAALSCLVPFHDSHAAAFSPGKYIVTHADPWIPNFTAPEFAGGPVVTSVRDGNWSDPGTWGGAVPGAAQAVIVKHVVTFDTQTEVYDLGVYPGGTLTFRTDINTLLKVGTVEVMVGGTLIIGSQQAPIAPTVTAQIIFKDRAISPSRDPGQYGNGLLGFGTVVMFGAIRTPSFVRMSREPLAGDSTLSLSQAVTGWRAGDRLILPDTRQLKGNEQGSGYVPQWEELTVSGVSADGQTISLSSALRYSHRGARDGDGTLKFLPHVGNLGRNIILRSENPTGTRAHTIFIDYAVVDIRYVSFVQMGRTTIGALNDTMFDANGNATHLGSQQRGRYALHAHHLTGPIAPSPDGYQFKFIGNAIDGGSTTYSFKWGIDIHASHYGLIQQNVVYNLAGAGIAFETGDESFDVLDNNFVVRVYGAGGRSDNTPDLTTGANGRGIWARGPNSYIRNNVVANITPVTDTYAYEYFTMYLGNIAIPAFPGADPMIPSQWTMKDGNSLPLLEFSGNEAYGALESGMTLWWIGTFGDTLRTPATPSVVRNLYVWNVYRQGFWNYPVSNMIIDGAVIRGDAANPGQAIGMYFDDYTTDQVIVRNADIQGMALGLGAPVMFINNPLFRIENSYFRNVVNISIPMQWSCCYVNLAPRQVIISGARFDPLGSYLYRTISMDWFSDSTLNSKMADLIQTTQVYVIDYNQRPGVSFQIFFLQQNPLQIVPQAIVNLHTGSPVAGLTNLQTWAQYHMALAGAIAPCLNTTSYPEILGYVCPGTYSGPALSTTQTPAPVSLPPATSTPSATSIPTASSASSSSSSTSTSTPPPSPPPPAPPAGLPKPIIGYDAKIKGFSYSGITSQVTTVVVLYCEMTASGACSYGQTKNVGLTNPISPYTLVDSTTRLLCAKIVFQDKSGNSGPQSDGACIDPVPPISGSANVIPKPIIGYNSKTKGFSYSGKTAQVTSVVVFYCEMAANGACSYGQSLNVGLINPIPPKVLVVSTQRQLCAKLSFQDSTGKLGPQSDGLCVDPVK
jgi:hypothetical protein